MRLSSDLSQKFGKGFSPTNLKMMRLFYQSFPIRQTMSDKSQKSKSYLVHLTPIDDFTELYIAERVTNYLVVKSKDGKDIKFC